MKVEQSSGTGVCKASQATAREGHYPKNNGRATKWFKEERSIIRFPFQNLHPGHYQSRTKQRKQECVDTIKRAPERSRHERKRHKPGGSRWAWTMEDRLRQRGEINTEDVESPSLMENGEKRVQVCGFGNLIQRKMMMMEEGWVGRKRAGLRRGP